MLIFGTGGWLVIDDFDVTLLDSTYPTADVAVAALFQKMRTAQNRLMAARSGEQALTWGRSLYQHLRALGLVNVDMQGFLAMREGRSPAADLIRQEAITAGFITKEEVEQLLILLDDPDFVVSAPVMFTAWGRRL